MIQEDSHVIDESVPSELRVSAVYKHGTGSYFWDLKPIQEEIVHLTRTRTTFLKFPRHTQSKHSYLWDRLVTCLDKFREFAKSIGGNVVILTADVNPCFDISSDVQDEVWEVEDTLRWQEKGEAAADTDTLSFPESSDATTELIH